MRDNNVFVGQGRQCLGKFRVQPVTFQRPLLVVLPVVFSVGRVCVAQHLGDIFHLDFCVGGGKPDVRVCANIAVLVLIAFAQRDAVGGLHHIQVLIGQAAQNRIDPMLHARAAVNEHVGIFQIGNIGCGRLPVVGFGPGRNHIGDGHFIAADLLGKIIHRVKTGHDLERRAVR